MSVDLLVPIMRQKTKPEVHLTATGRQVKITVKNTISKAVLEDVNIKIAGTTAKTDKDGTAIVVVPANSTEEKAELSLDGYNTVSATTKISQDKIQNNDFTMTPEGKVYFLSKLSGKIDVVKTNLDGTDRKTVLAGTGKEEDRNTILLASRDWNYLALLSRRAGNSPSLYMIDTASDNVSTVDEGNADFNLTGWVDGNFVYTVTRNNIQPWQPNRESLKSYNASTKKLTTLEQTTAEGSGSYDSMSQSFGQIYGYGGEVYYILQWNGTGSYYDQAKNKQATFNSVKPDGSAKKAIKSFSTASDGYYSVNLDERITSPDSIELEATDGAHTDYFTYSNGQVKNDTNMNQQKFYDTSYPTFLQSPSGKDTFWSESRDGKNTLFVGGEDGDGEKQIAQLSDYNTYGWYTDDYLLVSKNGSELYIMGKDGKQVPVKISDYHKPDKTFFGYGGGYGGF
jgi:hypothetical protein